MTERISFVFCPISKGASYSSTLISQSTLAPVDTLWITNPGRKIRAVLVFSLSFYEIYSNRDLYINIHSSI